MDDKKNSEHPGQILKALRLSKSMTLHELSEKTLLPPSTLSKLENGKMTLTYDKLVRLGAGLEEDLGRLLSGSSGPDTEINSAPGRRSVARAGENMSVRFKVQRHIYPASELTHKSMLPIIIDVTAKSVKELGGLLSHKGEEYIYVLEGTMELHSEFYEPLRLSKGDSVYFDSGMAHGYVHCGDTPCQVLVICSGKDADMISRAAIASANGADMGH